jgi:uncharacterized protein (AIM24 family)
MELMTDPVLDTALQYELRFTSLVQSGRGFAFPCDCKGQVMLDSLSERALANYLFARAVVGRELNSPQVVAAR